jgi:hypothetical protein
MLYCIGLTYDVKLIAEISIHSSPLRNILESTFFYSKEQRENYKLCTKKIFHEESEKQRKGQKPNTSKKFLQLFCDLRNVCFSIIIGYID